MAINIVTRRQTRTLRLSKHLYRDLAERTKAVGLALNVSTFKHLGCWGTYTPWALLVCKDAASDTPEWHERALINVAASINADRLRAVGAGRPEVDWSVLEDHEIYPFLVEHEIGHRQDNFDNWRVMTIEDLKVRDECHRRIKFVNELLADRYAWERIRPGEPIPLSEYGKKVQDKAAETLEYLQQHAPKLRACRPEGRLATGEYCDVPDYMLASPSRAAFLGPRVNKRLLAERSEYYRRCREERPRNPLF